MLVQSKIFDSQVFYCLPCLCPSYTVPCSMVFDRVLCRVMLELPWPSGYDLRLSLERSRILIPVKVIGGRQEGHPVHKCSLLQQSPN